MNDDKYGANDRGLNTYNIRRKDELLEENERLREENEWLLEENERLQAKVDRLTARGFEDLGFENRELRKEIKRLREDNACYVAMKEGVGVRIADLEAEVRDE